ncbi:H-NS family nucleoid-associated regulatory protein [Limnohabitans lacus]|uniref:H-NS family nucleoid-associated regulatory protein n=1 Tax=Limnohabitans lacus TaxID=3045173 RepID=A0ABT6X5Y1_9BURK|nr:H-NS family nucleoid-associated regulatory protein [Limnohabitans sp. HM2-2]MDI9233525.1 H-NS family nucleoid-associated regulatory protein [Limnohabitans sp. HM2-2]
MIKETYPYRFTPTIIHAPESKSTLAQLVSACADDCGGVVALFGISGSGKSTIALDYASTTKGIQYFDGLSPNHHDGLLPALNGIVVIDEVWQFKNARDVIAAHVNKNKGVVVAVACRLSEIEMLCGDHLKAAIEVSRGDIGVGGSMAHAMAGAQPQKKKKRSSGVIRYRSPSGHTWTGVGRTPKWLQALEMCGHPISEFRVSSPDDQKYMKD